MSCFVLDPEFNPENATFLSMELLNAAILSKNRLIIGSGLLNWFTFIPSEKRWSWMNKGIRKYSVPPTVNGLPPGRSRPWSHFMKQASSGNSNGNESSMTKWMKSQSMVGSNLTTFWTWRREPRTSTLLSVEGAVLQQVTVIRRFVPYSSSDGSQLNYS